MFVLLIEIFEYIHTYDIHTGRHSFYNVDTLINEPNFIMTKKVIPHRLYCLSNIVSLVVMYKVFFINGLLLASGDSEYLLKWPSFVKTI